MTQSDLDLSVAQGHVRAAEAALTEAVAQLERARAAETLHARDAEAAAARALEAGVDDAIQYADQRRNADVVAAAASRAAAAAKRVCDAARAKLQSAKVTEQQCKNVVLTILGEADADKLARDEAIVATRRRRLTALLEFPGFVASPKIARAIGDDVNTRICDIQPSGQLNTPLNLIGMVQAAEDGQAYWSQCLEARSQVAQHEPESFVEVRSTAA